MEDFAGISEGLRLSCKALRGVKRWIVRLFRDGREEARVLEPAEKRVDID